MHGWFFNSPDYHALTIPYPRVSINNPHPRPAPLPLPFTPNPPGSQGLVPCPLCPAALVKRGDPVGGDLINDIRSVDASWLIWRQFG